MIGSWPVEDDLTWISLPPTITPSMISMMSRRLPALVAVLSLLVAQTSLAALACPMSDPAEAVPMADCAGHEMPGSTDLTCKQHCQTADPIPVQPRDMPVLSSFILVVPFPEPRVAGYAAPVQSRLQDTMATAPPVAVRFCRFLI